MGFAESKSCALFNTQTNTHFFRVMWENKDLTKGWLIRGDTLKEVARFQPPEEGKPKIGKLLPLKSAMHLLQLLNLTDNNAAKFLLEWCKENEDKELIPDEDDVTDLTAMVYTHYSFSPPLFLITFY